MSVTRTKNFDFTSTLTLTAGVVAITGISAKVDSLFRQKDPIWSSAKQCQEIISYLCASKRFIRSFPAA